MSLEKNLSVVYSVSRSYIPYLLCSLASVPRDVTAIVAFVGDAGKTHLNELPRPVEWFHIQETERFNRARTLNAAIAQVRTPRVMIADADMIFPRILFSTLNLLAKTNIVYRFFIARFGEAHTNRSIAGADPWKVTLYSGWRDDDRGDDGPLTEGGDILRVFASVNPCVYDTGFLRKLGCYDERFENWGDEDDELYRKGLASGAEELRLPIVVGHLYHEVFRDFAVPWKET